MSEAEKVQDVIAERPASDGAAPEAVRDEELPARETSSRASEADGVINVVERGEERVREPAREPAEREARAPVQAADLGEDGATRSAPAGQSQAGRTVADGDGEPAPKDEGKVPESVRKRYLQAEGKFYFRGDPSRVAFEDRGRRLATELNDPEVARSMIELASAKGWSSVKLSGSDEFRREAWLHARVKGFEVSGYEATPVDLARLAEAKQRFARSPDRPGNAVDERSREATRGAAPQAAQHQDDIPPTAARPAPSRGQRAAALEAVERMLREGGATAQDAAAGATAAARRATGDRVYVGTLLEHGPGRYGDDPSGSPSYFVKLATPTGERAVWGVDLARAVADGRVRAGDQVMVAHQGSRAVEVATTERGSSGEVVGERTLSASRNAWDVVRLDQLQERAQAATDRAAPGGARIEPAVDTGLSARGEQAVKTLQAVVRARGDSEEVAKRVGEAATARLRAIRHKGTLIDYGTALHPTDARKGVSEFATLEQRDGKRLTVWGRGLEDAIRKSGATTGAEVTFSGSPGNDGQRQWEAAKEADGEQQRRKKARVAEPVIKVYDSRAPRSDQPRAAPTKRKEKAAQRERG